MLKIEILYCAVWHYTEKAIGLMAELVRRFEYEIEDISLIPSDGGRFEISVNGNLIYSKLKTNRHAKSGEVLALVRKFI